MLLVWWFSVFVLAPQGKVKDLLSLVGIKVYIFMSANYNACQKSWNTDVSFQGQINHPPLPHGTMLVYYETGLDFRKHFLLRLFYDISLNHHHYSRGKGAEVIKFFRKKK